MNKLKQLQEGKSLTLAEMNELLPCKFVLSSDKKEQTKLSSNRINKLSKRELEIAKLIKNGFTNKEISSSVNIAYETVKTHRKNIFNKLNISSISQLVSLSI